MKKNRILILEGTAETSIEREIELFIDEIGFKRNDFEIRRLSGTFDSTERILNELSFQPMLPVNRIIILREFHKIQSSASAEIINWLGKLGEDTSVVIVVDKLTQRLKGKLKDLKGLTLKKVKNPYSGEIKEIIRFELQKHGCRATGEAVQLMSDIFTDTPFLIKGEIEKLSVALGDGAIVGTGEVETYLSEGSGTSVFHFFQYIGNRDLAGAMNWLSEAGGDENSAGMIVLMFRHFRILIKASSISRIPKNWKEKQKIAGLIGVSPYFASEYVKESRNFSRREFSNILKKILRADTELKSGSVNRKIVIERLVLNILGNID